MRLKKPSVSCTVKPIVRSSYQLVSFCFLRLGALVVKPLTPRASQLAVVMLMLLMTLKQRKRVVMSLVISLVMSLVMSLIWLIQKTTWRKKMGQMTGTLITLKTG